MRGVEGTLSDIHHLGKSSTKGKRIYVGQEGCSNSRNPTVLDLVGREKYHRGLLFGPANALCS